MVLPIETYQNILPSGNIAIENYHLYPFIVDFPMKSMVIFHSYVGHYQRLNPMKSHETTIFLWFSYGFPLVWLPSDPFEEPLGGSRSVGVFRIDHDWADTV